MTTSVVRVAHLITTLDIGGAERMLCKLVKGQNGAGPFEHHVICLGNGGKLVAELQKDQIPVYVIGMRKRMSDLAALVRVARVLRRLRPHLIQTWLYHADLVGTVAGRLFTDAKLVWNVRCSNMDLGDYGVGTRIVFKILARASSIPEAIVFNSSAGMRFHAKANYRVNRSRIIPNGFDIMRYRSNTTAREGFRSALGIAESIPVIGIVARYDPMKDFESFFAAAAMLRQMQPVFKLVAVGRGMVPGNVAVQEMIQAHGLSGHVHLMGEQKDLETIYPGFDLMTLTSAYGEGFPNVLGEAMACGIPCVATDVGDAKVIIGDTGLVVPPGQPRLIASAWQKMLARPPLERETLGKRARNRIVSSYSLGAIRESYSTLWHQLNG